MCRAIAHHPLTDAQSVLEQGSPSQPAPSRFIAENDVVWYGMSLWPAGVSFPESVPSQPILHPQLHHCHDSMRKVLDLKYCCATTNTSVFYQHYSHSKSKTWHLTSY